MAARLRWAAPAALALLAAAAVPSGAATFCVSDPVCVIAGGVDRGGDLQAALTAATTTSGADVVKLGAGRFSAADGFSAQDTRDAISVVGSSFGTTTLTATTAGRRVLDFGSSARASVSDLSIAMPPSGGVGVFVPQQITRVRISGGSGVAYGLWTQNTRVEDVVIDLPLGNDNQGVYRPNGTLTADGLTITARQGITGQGTRDAYRHLRITSDGTGISLGGSNTSMTIDDAQIRVTGSGVGLLWNATFGNAASLTAQFLTIRGDGTAGSIGVRSYGQNAGSSASVVLSSSIVAGFDHALACATAAGGQARLTARWSAFDPADLLSGCATAIDTGTGNTAADPLLTAAPNGDLLLAASSPAIDAGDPALLTPSPATDLAGGARLLDGDGDGTARVDMGAFERDPSGAGREPGPPILPGPGPNPGPGPGPGVRAPEPAIVRAFSVTRRRFAPLRRGARGRTSGGARFAWDLSAPSRVRIRVEQLVPGRVVGRACRARARGRGRTCTRAVVKQTLDATAAAGRGSIAFSGRRGRRALPSGRYRATIVASVSGAPDSLPRSVQFTLLP